MSIEHARIELLAQSRLHPFVWRVLVVAVGRRPVLGDARGLAEEQSDESVLRRLFRAGPDRLRLFASSEPDGDLQQIPNHRLDVSTHVAHLRELRRLHLHEGGFDQAGHPPGDLRLADPGRTEHHDVSWSDLAGHLGCELATTPAVSNRDRHRSLGVGLTDDVTVEGRHHLGGGQGVA